MSRTVHFVSKSKRRLTLFGVLVIALASTVGAVAYFTSNGTGSATASTGNLNAPTSVVATATVGSGSVPINWAASSTSGGAVVPQGYYVVRVKNSDSSTAAACGSASSLISGTSCSDTSVPDGTYHYVVTAVFHSWTAKALSNDVTVQNDVTAPTSTATLSPLANGPGWNKADVLVTLNATDNTGGSGVKNITYSASGAQTISSTTVTGSSTSFTINTEGTTTVTFHATDNANNVESPAKTQVVKLDKTAPVTSDDTASIGNGWQSNSVTVHLSVTETGSGVDKTYFTTNGTYTIEYFSTDIAGNTETVETAGTVIRIDKTAPSAPALTLSAASGNSSVDDVNKRAYINPQAGDSGSFQVAATSTDAESGISKINFAALTGFSAGGGDVSSPGPYTTTYTWSGAVAASGAQTVTAFNGASPALSTPSSFTVIADTTAPSNGTLSAAATSATAGGATAVNKTGTFAISTTPYTETAGTTASGLKSSTLTRSSATYTSDGLSAGVCGSFGTAATIASNTSSDTQPTGCYRYTLTGIDNVGNTASVRVDVKVDTTVPSTPTISLTAAGATEFASGTTLYYNAQGSNSGSFTVTAATTDNDSGIASVSFPSVTGFGSGGSTSTSPFQSTYNWTAASTTTGSQNVTSTNGVAGVSAAGTFTLVKDVTAPTAGALTANTVAATASGSSSTNKTGTFAIATTNFGETQSTTQSGIATNSLTRAFAAFATPNLCGTFGAAVDITGATTQTGLADGCYLYTFTGTDHVGNAVSLKTTVSVDSAAPGAPTAVTLQNGGGPSSNYINIANKSSVSVNVTVAENSTADTVNVTITDGTHIVTKSTTVTGATTTVTGIDVSTLTDGTGNVTISATETDAAANTSATTTAATTYNKDVVAPTITGVVSANKTGGTAGQAEAGDTITLSFSEAILGASVASTSNVVLSTPNGNSMPVTLTMPGLSGAFVIATNPAYLAKNSADANFNGSPLSQPTASQVRVTLAAQSGGTTTVGTSQSVTVPASASLTDLAGNPATGSFTLTIRFF
jgi:hypothetical protein